MYSLYTVAKKKTNGENKSVHINYIHVIKTKICENTKDDHLKIYFYAKIYQLIREARLQKQFTNLGIVF